MQGFTTNGRDKGVITDPPSPHTQKMNPNILKISFYKTGKLLPPKRFRGGG